jgi:hypothetical protein
VALATELWVPNNLNIDSVLEILSALWAIYPDLLQKIALPVAGFRLF